MDAIVGRVSDGRLRSGVEVHLADAATGALLRSVTTGTAEGFAGHFAFPAEMLGPPGRPVKLVVVLDVDNAATGGTQGSVATIEVPEPGEVVDVRFVLPPAPARTVAANPDRDADRCSACLLDGTFAPWAADETGQLIAPLLAGRGRAPLAAVQVVDDNALPADSTWRRHVVGRIIVDYAVAGPHALPAGKLAAAADAAAYAGGRIAPGAAPLHVQQVALIAARALDRFTRDFGLRDPENGGPIRIRLCRIEAETPHGTRAVFGQTDARWDHVRINVGNGTAQNEGTVPHELFHRIQYRYNDTDDADAELHRAVREGTATLAEEALQPDANRYVLRARDHFAMPWVPIAAPRRNGSSQPYAAALFWRWLEEQQPGRAAQGPRADRAPSLVVVKMILEATATIRNASPGGAMGYRFAALRQRLIRTVRHDQFAALADGDATTACTDTLYGNWLLTNALTRVADRVKDRRFRYAEWDQPTTATVSATGQPIPPMRLIDLPRPVMDGDAARLRPGRTVIMPAGSTLPAWSARYFRFVADGLVRFAFACADLSDPPMVLLARLDPEGSLTIRRGQGPRFETALVAGAQDELALVVGCRTMPAAFRLSARLLAPAPLPFITSWNCGPGDGHETDDAGGSPWTWTSPDLAVEQRGAERRARVRICNQGNAASAGGTLRLDWAPTPRIDAPCRFAPLTGADGARLACPVPALAPGASASIETPWSQQGVGASGILRAVATLATAPLPAQALTWIGPPPDRPFTSRSPS